MEETMYPEKTIRRMMNPEDRNDRNGTGSWWMCPVCGNGDDNDVEPESGWNCWSCNPEAVAEEDDENGMQNRYAEDNDEGVVEMKPGVRYLFGWEKYPSCGIDQKDELMNMPE